MPFSRNADLPANVRSSLPSGAQSVWRDAFNAAMDGGRSEASALRIAWSAVRRAGYEPNPRGGQWRQTKKADGRPLGASFAELRDVFAKAQTFKPPKTVRDSARRGLELRRRFGRGGTAVGVARARDLANGKGIPLATLRRMRAFFDRHEGNKDTPPSEGNGQIAWLLWGGSAGRRWAEGILNREDAKKSEPKFDVEIYGEITKLDEEQQMVFGWGYVCRRKDGSLVVDHSGEVVSIKEIEKAAYDYCLHARDMKQMHRGDVRGSLIELFVSTKEKRAAMGIAEGQLPDGLWLGFKIHDEQAWKDVKSGRTRMFSLGGRAQRREL
jgi:cation transport regulator ChaB